MSDASHFEAAFQLFGVQFSAAFGTDDTADDAYKFSFAGTANTVENCEPLGQVPPDQTLSGVFLQY
jgi:hypothetical protein